MIRCENVRYKIGDRTILDIPYLKLQTPNIYSILGPNGAGKSTLMLLISGLLEPTSGEIYFDDKPLHKFNTKELAQKRSILFQKTNVSSKFKVSEVIELGRSIYAEPLSTKKKILTEVVELLDLRPFVNRYYNELSGGEQQRVQLARVLAQILGNESQPRILFLDEPQAGLDIKYQLKNLKICSQLLEKNISTIFISHDLNVAMQQSHQTILLKNGNIKAEGNPVNTLTKSNLDEVFEVDFHFLKTTESNFPIITNLMNHPENILTH